MTVSSVYLQKHNNRSNFSNSFSVTSVKKYDESFSKNTLSDIHMIHVQCWASLCIVLSIYAIIQHCLSKTLSTVISNFIFTSIISLYYKVERDELA